MQRTSIIPEPFTWSGDHVAIALPGGRVVFTTRQGGVSEGPYASLNLGRWTDDDPAAVKENRRRLAAAIGFPLDAVVQGRQVHRARVERNAPPGGEPQEADGQATTRDDVALLVLTADCLPIALVAREAVAMLHAGWRGLAEGIVEQGVAALRTLGAGEIRAAIGPGAGPCCYEVGADVAEAFGRTAGPLDLKAIARERLEAAGVVEVHDVDLCTICSDPSLFFSHRRDGGVTGRQAGVVWQR
jgi:purine-nucleoside/S-methyl-5'-thioadenosine phosphorylase / adenosine deaminase